MPNKKTILITGATEGIGLATAVTLGRQGQRLLLHGRNEAKLSAAVGAAKAAGAASAEGFLADFGALAEVRDLARQVGENHQLDVIVNNAAAMFSTRRETTDGLEANFGINTVAPALLTLELLSKLDRSGRIVNLSSVGYKQAKPNFNDLQSTAGYAMQGAYFNSKLFNLYTTLVMARRLGSTGKTVNAVHPGGVRTQLARDFKPPMKWIFAALMPIFFITPEKGADTSVFPATDESVASVIGQYFVKRKPEALKPIGADVGKQEQLWAAVLAILRERAGLAPPSEMV